MARCESRTRRKDAIIAELQTTLGTAKQKFLDGDHDGILALIVEDQKTANEKRLDAISLQIEALTAEKESIKSEN